jgi:predicted metal-dependent phosphoesterase TrpH
MKADLHVHSTASDGTLAPRDLVRRACALGVDILAVADHDSVSGIPEATMAATECPLTLIPAVELSAVSAGRDVHILAYFIDPLSADLLAHLVELRSVRLARAAAMVAALTAAGFEVSLDDVLQLSGGGAVGRSHIARALVGAGHAESVSDAFERLIGRNGPFYVAKDSTSPEEVIRGVREMGAVPVVAHPGITRVDDLIPDLAACGLLGIEAYHADHRPEQRTFYRDMADSLGLVATGGTDFHGLSARNPDIGAVDVPEECVLRLLELGGAA